MAEKKQFQRIHRTRRLTPEEIARDNEIRAKVMVEFPPKPQPVIPEVQSVVAELKQERESQGLSVDDVSRRTGIPSAVLSRLESGSITNPAVAILSKYAEALGKSLTVGVGDSP